MVGAWPGLILRVGFIPINGLLDFIYSLNVTPPLVSAIPMIFG